ncbi:MAG: transposase [Chloroflexi bacterium]|nr:transposase [Chloroflexota bacterium]
MSEHPRITRPRRSIRLPNWDYRSPGYYFVTICTHQRQHLFETIAYQEIAAYALQAIPTHPHAQHMVLDEWIVMPNHLHAIFIFTDYPLHVEEKGIPEDKATVLAGSLGVVIARYKAIVTKRINHLRRKQAAPVWQRGYYERIIRNEREWHAVQQYIRDNPIRWAEDRDNLDALIAKMTYRSGL